MREAVRVVGVGRAPAEGWVELEDLPLRRRMVRAGRTVAIGLVVGLLFLPVPLIHLFGVFVFLATVGLAVRQLRTVRVLVRAGGVCPGCGAEGTFFVGFGGGRFRLPLATSCRQCAMALALEYPSFRAD